MQLKNGLTVILDDDRQSPVVSMQLWVRAGSIYENEKNYGLSHFLEHLVFKGTEKYSAEVLSKLAETSGGVINAATSKEFTFYFIDIVKEEQQLALSILSQIAFAATFPPAELEKERPVVIEEIRRHEDNPEGRLSDDFFQIICPNSNYRNRVIGSSEVIKNVSRPDIINYYKNFYRPENMVLSISGNIAENLLEEIERTFGSYSAPAPFRTEPVNLSVEPGKFLAKKEKVTQGYFLSGWKGPKNNEIDKLLAAEITATVLGGGRASRFYQNLREKKHLVYDIGVNFEAQLGDGIFIVSAIFPPAKRPALIKEINQEFARLRKAGITEPELYRAKQILKSSWLFAQEAQHERAQIYAYWSILNNPSYPQQYLQVLEGLNLKDVNNFIQQFPPELSGIIYVPEK